MMVGRLTMSPGLFGVNSCSQTTQKGISALVLCHKLLLPPENSVFARQEGKFGGRGDPWEP